MKDIVIRLNNLFSWKAMKTKTSETFEHNNKHKKNDSFGNQSESSGGKKKNYLRRHPLLHNAN